MSRPDRIPPVAVDFAPPAKSRRGSPLLPVAVALLSAGAIAIAVSQLLLR